MPTPPNLTPPTGNSRSGSPSNDQPRARIVSGSIRDRMARFENPTAAPLIPTHPFGTAGPAQPSTAARGGLVGNRIPSLDPKTAGLYGGNRKVSENRGLVGNRIPSGTVGSVKTASSTGARSASPSGSVDSSTASAANTFASPNTSRASSPPSSPGHPHDIITSSGLLSATEPDNGGPGAMTPSSTRAEAGEEVSQFSAPSTPVQAPAQTSGHYDLVPPNLKLASGEAITPSAAQLALTRGLSNLSVARSATGAQSLGSSRVSQYDPGSQGSENQETMLKDVSNVSTPHSTPRAERNELEGSVRGEESVRGEGSIADEGDLKETTQAMGGLGIEGVDRDPTPEPPAQAESHKDESIKEGGFVKASEVDGNVVIDDEPESTPAPPHPNDLPDPSQPSKEDAEVDIPINAGEHIDEIAGKKLEEDPNQADDLADLKSGNLSRKKAPHGTHSVDQNPINNIVEAGISMGLDEQVVPTEELKEQGGVAGERIEDVEKPDAVEQPKDKSEDYAANDELEVRTATATNESAAGSSESAQTQHVSEPESASQQTKDSKEEKVSTIQQKDDDLPRDSMPDIIEGKRAAGLRLDDAEGAGAGPLTSGETDKLKDHLNEERRKAAEKEIEKEESQGADPNEGLQTEEDRDEGKSRREQLIEALDQNKNADEDLQEEVDEETRAKARGVTEKITAELRDKEEEGDAEEDVEKKVAADKGEHKETVQADKVTQDAGQANLSKLEKDLEEDKDDETQSNEHKKPIRVQLEPAPIAQPAEDVDEDDTAAKDAIAEPKVESDASKTPAPSFPTPPSEDPDVVDPITPESAQPETIQASEPATPLDTNVIKSFPEVPDEEKPRVEVHVSHSPLNSPMKGVHNDHQPETPLAKLPGTSKSLSTQDLAKDAESGSESGEGRRSMEVEGTPSATKSAKRLSTRRSPKSPLLDDEDPGDFEPGEGYVVVTKGRESK